MRIAKFSASGFDNSVVFKTIDKLDFSENELLALWSFDNHVKRLTKFVRPFYKEMHISYVMASKRVNVKNKDKNIPTELRLSAAINELRPFMLEGDSINFCKIRNIVARRFRNDDGMMECLKMYKRIWNGYDINKKSRNSVNMSGIYDIDNVSIATYSDLLRIFTYGKYIHNGDNPKDMAVVYRMENAFYYPSVRVELGTCVARMCNILRIFDKDLVKPILRLYDGTIKELNWNSINITNVN